MEVGDDNNAESEVVISVHGTFAARQEDEGHDWWQCNRINGVRSFIVHKSDK